MIINTINNLFIPSDRALFLWHEQQKQLYTQELHDTVLQEQIVVAKAVEDLIKDYAAMRSEDIVIQLAELYEYQQDMIYSIRQYCVQLRSPILSGENFAVAITRLIDRVHRQSNIEVSFNIFPNSHCSSEIEGHLYRMIQELLRNAMKHSEATEVNIHLTMYDEGIDLIYSDNGIGIEIDQEFVDRQSQHMGISGLYFRTGVLGGTISIESERNQGVNVTIHIPHSIYV